MKWNIFFIVFVVLIFCEPLLGGGMDKGSVPQHFLTHEVEISKLTAQLAASEEFVGYLKYAIYILGVVISALWFWLRSVIKDKDAIMNSRLEHANRVINLSKGGSL